MTDLMPIRTPLAAQPAGPAQKAQLSPEDRALWDVAQKLEASFLSEMLKSAGFGKPREAMGGGAGEDQFSSFLREAQAGEMVKAGGIGLAESLFEALKEKNDVQP
jgi:Rod binding domain-containing protein